MALDIASANAHVEILDDPVDIILLEALLDGVEKYTHELLHILLLEALTCVPAKARGQARRTCKWQLADLKRRKQLLQLIQNAVLLLAVDRWVVTKDGKIGEVSLELGTDLGGRFASLVGLARHVVLT